MTHTPPPLDYRPSTTRPRWFRRILLPLLAIVCYFASFFLPALYLKGQANTNGQPTYMSGLGAFFDGLFAMFGGQFAWCANPLAVLALTLLVSRLYIGSLVISLAALLVAQQTWAVVGTTISGDEGGVTKYLVTGLGPGFYLWSFSYLLLAIAAVMGRLRRGEPEIPSVT
jgi:hypothetical protein